MYHPLANAFFYFIAISSKSNFLYGFKSPHSPTNTFTVENARRHERKDTFEILPKTPDNFNSIVSERNKHCKPKPVDKKGNEYELDAMMKTNRACESDDGEERVGERRQ